MTHVHMTFVGLERNFKNLITHFCLIGLLAYMYVNVVFDTYRSTELGLLVFTCFA